MGERPLQPAQEGPQPGPGESEAFDEILRRLEQAVAESRSMARTLSRLCEGEDRWHDEFRERWIALLLATGPP